MELYQLAVRFPYRGLATLQPGDTLICREGPSYHTRVYVGMWEGRIEVESALKHCRCTVPEETIRGVVPKGAKLTQEALIALCGGLWAFCSVPCLL
jgi:hypothetical protein